ncbi:adhesion G protein-coupled receptor A3 isoform X2 [Pseudomyrmex gracilis]|nr:adhesion G protein-coupled receptor A3 isoform X2 [Pseudomyrmex gracilis]XP_020288379.1 adhesion G protein-coupled receptor A3 isoform X2 [Pseudomyrmex gracilis]XP_020288380.1 adhesion G protein-coupled receptor A3 isoform X2 [Pseudomyrmex gracilis]XP_020288381.1 adhesion G protein-coupled receptor A3 isoform X2 [Pseudomyrmex gracilis]XP_020288382.1 adhesion G protein-coupled receptor A3 isoform X2 [Pseudomyrmex gracilis]XP_020288383.1 adhesion G protein-coupled receptor A3 isoform X2 [Pseu
MKATLLFVIVLQTWTSAIQLCPQHCSCKSVGPQAEWLRLKCGDHLEEIKNVDINAVSVELTQLDLSRNAIHIIQADVFLNLTNLKKLDLSKNKLSSIGEGCFNGLEKLEKLDLSQNQISVIDSYAFKQLPNLRRLDLSGNKITALAPSLFHDLLALDRLKLNGNSLTTLKEGTFHGLKMLKQLDLTNNPWKCNCDLYWFSDWIYNSSLKLNPPPKCDSPAFLKGQPVKKMRFTEELQCQWISPAIEIRPVQNQVVFAGDSITLKCRAPSITVDKSARLNWLWYPNASAEVVDLSAYKDPRTSLPNIRVDNRNLSDSGIVDSALSIVPVKEEHNGQWNCLLVSVNGNKSMAVSVIVISENTRYCPLAVTRNNKGVYSWPKTIVGWKAELPCEGHHLSSLMQAPLKASYHCNMSGHWEHLNTESCPYISRTTKVLEQFAKVNLSLTRVTSSLMETAKRFKNYTGNISLKLQDPVEIHFIVQTIENYLNYLTDEKELGFMLIDIVSSMMEISKEMLKRAEINFKACTRLIRAIERLIEFTPSVQSHKRHVALEEFRVKRDSFSGLTCTWYTNVANSDSDSRFLHCTTINRTTPISAKDNTIEASVQLPGSLLRQLSHDGAIAQQLMISMFSDSRLFPKTIVNDSMDITTCIVGSKLIGTSVQNLSEPVYIMLRTPLYHYNRKRPKPVVWDETYNNVGGWSSDGCYLTNLLNNLIVFHCNRLGYYGLQQEVSHLDGNSVHGARFRYSHPAIYIGSFVTITCLTIMSVTYIISYTSITMPKKAKHSVVNTWFAMTLLSFLYSIGIQQTENVKICQGVGLALHYLTLCCLLWMAVSASNMYKKFAKSSLDVIPDDELPDQPLPKPLLGLYLVGWGIALIICGISGAINLREYAGYAHCFLRTGPALAALFVPSGILLAYLLIVLLLIRRAIQNVDTNAQLSDGTQATENMDLELLEPNANSSGDRNSVHSTQTVSSDIEDPEHSQIAQWKGQIIMLILFLMSWSSAAAVTIKPFNSMPFEETVFSVIYAVATSTLGIFVLFFYGIARNDVRNQWLKMRCWLGKRKNRCCRTRSVCDANAAMQPTQPLVQNFVPPLSNSQAAAQAISDTNSVASSRNTNHSQSQIYNTAKLADFAVNHDDAAAVTTVPAKAANLILLHRQQYRSNNSVTTYTEPSPACVEMFYNPHQSGVARKFFKKQRRHTAKKNNLGPRKQGDGGATSDGGSCVSIPRPTAKIDNSLERSILSSSAKVNNTNIHVELNPINDIKNVNILSDSGGSISEERNIPIRFVIGQENLARNVKKINNDIVQQDNVAMFDPTRGTLRRTAQDSDADISKIDEERCLRNVSQQCSLEYSSEMDVTQMTSERSDHNLPEICENAETVNAQDETSCFSSRKRCPSVNEIGIVTDEQCLRDTTRRLYLSNSMYCLPLGHERPLTNSYCNSLNDVASLASARHGDEFSKPSLTDVRSTTSSNLCGHEAPEFRRSYDRSLFEINSLTSDNPCTLTPHAAETPYACSLANVYCVSDKSLEENNFCEESSVDRNNVFNAPESKDLLIEKNFGSLADITSISKSSSRNIDNLELFDEMSAHDEAAETSDAQQQFEADNIYSLDESTNHLPVKKETSV